MEPATAADPVTAADTGAVSEAGAGLVSAEAVRHAVAELLGEDTGGVGLDDDLLRLGLDSIAVIRLAARWRRAGIEITAAELFEHRTVTEWARLLAGRGTGGATATAGDTGESDPPPLVAVDESAPFELATLQLAYWVGRQDDQLLGGVGAHFYSEFDGDGVDPQRLERAVRALIRRHPMLRARFLPDGRQQITADGAWPGLHRHDLRQAGAEEVEAACARLRAELSHRRLEVDRGEVFDVQLSLLPGGRSRLHVAIEMLVADAQSFRVLLSDLASYYLEPQVELAPVAISYPQYLATRAAHPDPRREESRRYWQQRLASLPPAPRLPLAVDPATLGRPTTTRYWHRLTAAQWRRATAVAADHGVTLPVLFLTAFGEVLTTWSGGHEVLLNLPLYDRQPLHPDVDRLVGDFTRTVLVRIDAGAGRCFADRARAVDRQLRADIDHSAYSGVEVLRDLARLHPGVAVGAPLVFTSAIRLGELFDQRVRSAFGDPGWTTSQTPQVWLDHQVTEREGELFLNWDVVEGLFPPRMVARMFDAYLGLLERLVDGDGWDGAGVPLPPEQARARAAVNSAPVAPIPAAERGEVPAVTPAAERGEVAATGGAGLHEPFFAHAARTPDATALRWGERGQLGYGELAGDALRVAAALREGGVAAGDVVAVCLPKGPDQIRAVLGVLAAGACYLPIGVEQPRERRDRILALATPTLAITDTDADAGWPVPVLPLPRALAAAELAAAAAVDGEALAYLLFTSGSTGEPKGVEVPHRAARATLDDLVPRLGMGPGDATLAVSELDFDLSVFDVFAALGSGAAVVLLTEDDRRTPAAWAALAARHRVTILNCVPAILDQILTEVTAGGAPPPSALRAVLLGGDWVGVDLPPRLAAVAPGCRFLALGGTTETAIHSTVCEVGQVEAGWSAIPYGVPLHGVSCRVVDRHGRDCPDWVTGELWIGGAGVARGYRGDPERTADRFVTADGVRWYRTGDLARYREGGCLEFLGRADHQVKLRGYRVELGEVDAALRGHPGLTGAAAAVFGSPPRVGAVVVPSSGAPLAEDQLRRHLADRLPVYMLPALLLPVPAVPLSRNGKVDRDAVRALLVAAADGGGDGEAGRGAPPHGQREEAVAALWQQLLGRDRIGRDDSFFALGGDSLLATRVVARLREAGYRDARLAQLFTAPRLADFAATLHRDPAGTGGGAEAGEAEADPGSVLVADPEHRHEPFPTTAVQRAYLLGRGGDFDLGAVGSHWYWEFDGAEVDLPRLQACWNQLVARHEMLRAVFDEQGRQRIQPQVSEQTIHVVTAAPGQEEQALARLRREYSHRVPDPLRWPLVAIAAVRYGDRCRVAFSFDYIVVDALSIVTLFAELSQLYADPWVALPPIGVSFRDYVVSVHPPRAELEAARRYWQGRLPTLAAGPELPLRTDPARLADPHFTRREARLEPAVWRAITARCREHGVTPAMALATAYLEVLAAWSARPELSVVHTVFDRREVHPDIGRVVGDFTSLMLVQRPAVAAGGGWARRVRAVQAEVWEAMEHRAVTAIDVMRMMGRAAGTATVSVPVVFTSALGLPEEITQFTTPFGEQCWGVSQTPQVWLDNQVMERDGGLSVNWDAVEQLFPAGLLDAMFGAYTDLLRQLADGDWSDGTGGDGTGGDGAGGDGVRAVAVPLPAGQRAIRELVNDTTAPLPRHRLHEPFFDRARSHPEADALRWGEDGRIGYGELAGRALRVAGALAAAGLGPGDVVAVQLERGVDQVTAVLGVLAAGAAYLPIAVEQPPPRREAILGDAGAAAVITATAAGETPGRRWLRLAELLTAEPLPAPVPVAAEELAYVIYTSGSTGTPKGVEITHQAAANTVDDVTSRFAVTAADRALAISALDFDLSVFDLFGLLGAGGAVVLPAPEQRREARAWVELIQRHRVSIVNCVPALLEMALLAAGESELATVRLALLSGDWIGLELPERLAAAAPRCRLVALGGATEAAIWSNAYEVTAVESGWRSIPYGYPLRNQAFRVVGPDGADRPDWVPGELWIGGAGVARGYRGDPERTADRFVTDGGRRWYRTGDLGRYWPDGTLEFLGRSDHQVKVAGVRIELGEVEAALEADPRVAAAVAVATPAPRRRLLAAVVPRPGADTAIPEQLSEELRRALAHQLPEAMVPDRIQPLADWPLTGNGKVDRGAVLRLLTAAAPQPGAGAESGSGSGSGSEGPSGAVETELAEMWGRLLAVERVGRQENFFTLGGDSLLATELLELVRRRFGVATTLRELFAGPTVAELAVAVQRLRGGAPEEQMEEGVL